MSGPLRSKQGCWTYRLRKKKCDESRPYCSTCHLLSITCYGFGPKPDWMNNAEQERAVADSLKEIVKDTWRRKATARFPKQRDSTIRIAPKSSNVSVQDSCSNPEPSRPHGAALPSDHGSSQEYEFNIPQDGSAASEHHRDHLMAGSIISISADDSVLLMHFLDHVFSLQYPFYQPRAQEGGRGWLLALLLRTKPFYHASLALSAYHRRTSILANISHPYRIAALVQQEQHLEICMKFVSQSTERPCRNSGVGVLASIIQLVFLEVFFLFI
jgi:C6 transcription factor Pro1